VWPFLCNKNRGGVFLRKGVSTSIIRSDPHLLTTLPDADLYELGFFKREDLGTILSFFKNKKFGVHAPFIYRYVYHPAPTSLNIKERSDTFSINRKCAELSKKIGAEYMVVHFPNAFQKESWLPIYREVESEFCNLSTLIPIRIENIYGNDHFHEAKDYKSFLENTNSTMCVDIGHLLIDSELYGFSPVNFVELLSDKISEFHIYYADLETYKVCHHAPWGNSKRFREILNFIKDMNVDFVIEPTTECKNGLERLLKYWREL